MPALRYDTVMAMATFNKRKSPASANTVGRTGAEARSKPKSVATRNQPKLVVVKSRGRYQVLAPAIAPRHVSAEQLEAAVLSLAR
jgi:hypothetical protein